MGSSTYWYRVSAEDFKRYVKVEDKFDKLEQKLYDKYQSVFDADNERFNREWDEVCDGKRPAKSVKDVTPIYKVVSPAEFDRWFTLMQKVNSLKGFANLEKLPYLYFGSSMTKVIAQWILNRRRKMLVKSDKRNGYKLRPKNEEWRFVLTCADIKDLIKRLESVCGDKRVDVHKAFPIYKNIIYGDIRSNPLHKLEEQNDIPYFAPHILEMLKFTITALYNDLVSPTYTENPLMIDILP